MTPIWYLNGRERGRHKETNGTDEHRPSANEIRELRNANKDADAEAKFVDAVNKRLVENLAS